MGTFEVYPGGETLVLALVPVDVDEAQGPIGAHLRADLHDAQVPVVFFRHQAGPHGGACKGRETALRVAGRGGERLLPLPTHLRPRTTYLVRTQDRPGTVSPPPLAATPANLFPVLGNR